MNVQVKHNGTTITGFVTSYERVHKICTGIGTLHIEISDSISSTFAPWDRIDIYENGDFKVRYYISSIEHAVNRSTYILDCQDNSKRIVDYFIPDSYTVDYPSYTRYWIEKFLTEAGVDFEFTTGSQGTLLSNYTNLGLVTVYEQILTLLQMSGWYMYFDGNGKAIIGSLNLDFAADRASVGKTDVLDISVESNDKMLRNKALVFGAYDAYTGTNAKASVTVHTPWNYDQRDIRTVVISNSNIPNNSTAYGMANQIIKEFARITVEKHITVWGARDFNLGTALRVTTNVWKGRGMITTFGTSMSKTGLVTNIVLDERCPRLFGYFDFGDYVYVATYGDGTWRKHIKFDPTWYNFSTGYTNLQITDLHINNGVFGSVGSSGEMYYAIDDLPWHNIPFSGLMSSIDTIASGEGINMTVFSGLKARAVIVDKYGNTVKFGVDTWNQPNYGDYFLMYSGMVHASGVVSGSGVTASGNRGWIVEYDVLGGDLTGTPYPISVSGNYDITVIDLENDGKNDYVSVKLGGGTPAPLTQNNITNWGYHQTQPFASTEDDTSYTAYPDAASIADINNNILGNQQFNGMNVQNPNALFAIDNMISGYSFVVTVGADRKARKVVFTRTFNVGLSVWEISKAVTTSAASAALVGATVLGIYPDLGGDTYRIFYRTGTYVSEGNITYKYIDWNALANTFGTATTISITSPQTQPAGTNVVGIARNFTVVRGDTIYNMNHYHRRNTGGGGSFNGPSHQYIDVVHIDMTGPSLINDPILDFETPEFDSSGNYYFFPANGINPATSEGGAATFESTIFNIFENGNEVQIIGRAEFYYRDGAGTTRSTREYLFYGNATVIQNTLIYSDDTVSGANIRRFPTVTLNEGSQLTVTKGFIGAQNPTAGQLSFVYNGTVFQTYSSPGSAFQYQYKFSSVRPVFADNNNQYIATNAGNFYLYSADDFSLQATLDFSGIGLYPDWFSGTAFGTFGTEVFGAYFDDNDGNDYIAPFNFTSFDTTRKIRSNTGIGSFTIPNITKRTINFGNFFVEDADYTLGDPIAGIYYVDIGTPDWEAATFLLLKRDGTDYTIIEEEAYPMRVDISNQAPVLTVGSGEPTFVSNYVYENSLTVIESLSISGQQVEDYRYAMLEPMVSGVVQSGYTSLSTILYIHGSGIFSADALTYSGGFTPIFGVPSGYGTRIETSRYGMGGQYIFITTSGNVQNFYQSDPASISGIAFFTLYSGLPQSRATIIRLDDAV